MVIRVRARLVRVGVAVCLALGPAGRAWTQTAPQAQPPLLTGQRISLDLKGVDILDVLKLLSQRAGLNFVAGRNVTGRVTVFVNDVDVWEAFELIISANDLAYERQGDIVTVMMARDYELIYGVKFQAPSRSVVVPLKYAKAVQAATVLNQVKSSVGRVVLDEATNTLILEDVPSRLEELQKILAQIDRPTATRVYSLNYADAEKLKDRVQELLSPIGLYTFDARTNRAIVTDLTEVLEKTDRVVRAFDTPDGEVLIEAKLLKVSLTDEFDLGIDWKRVLSGMDLDFRNSFDSISGDVIAGTSTGAAVRLVGTTTQAQAVLEALKKVAKTETLSNPSIMVSNNQEAKILVGTREAIVTVTTTVPATGSTVAAPEIEFVDVGTKLFVTPSVKRDGHIQMKIKPEVSSAEVQTFQNNRIPIVSSTEAETNVLVKSGTTLIIGGLIETTDAKTDSRVPLLGAVPILGLPFRGTVSTKKKTELVVFVTPQIVMPDGSPPPALPAEAAAIPDEAIPDEALPTVILKEPVPAAYRALILERLRGHLISQFRASQFRALSLQPGSVVISFVLSHDGRLVGEHDVTSPQGEPFVQAAKAALKEAEPFPPFPEGSDAGEVRFRLAVDYAP
jgi:type II secretory pathway component GspD/PulD (secretin)